MKITSRVGGSMVLARVVLAVAAALSCATPGQSAHAGAAGGLATVQGPYQVEVLLDGQTAPAFFHGGESYVLGQIGRRYTLRVWNRSHRRIEAVVSVDGRDVIDGKPGDFRNKRGYLVPAWGFLDIDGWRLSEHQAAAFRFTSVASSYAGRLGNPRNVGVIGVAVSPELERFHIAPPIYPYPHRSERHRSDDAREGAPAERGEESAPSEPAPSSTPAPTADARRSNQNRPGLGTEFGEAVSSSVHEVSFLRANSKTPAVLLGLRYNDRRGLLALGIDVDGPDHGRYSDMWMRQNAEPFPVSQRRYASPPAGWRR